MTIHLPQDLERFVSDAVRAGRYTREDDVIRDALLRLKQAMPEDTAMSGKKTEPGPQMKPLTEEEFKRQLLDAGLMTSLPTPPDPATSRAFQPVKIEGEPLSETIIRERR